MNALLDRQMEQFQHRVQQKINLADDEIQRLSTHLSLIKTDILDTSDQLNRTRLKATQLSDQASGRGKCLRAHMEAIVAKMRADHHIQMQELHEKQNQEIHALHNSFGETVAGLENLSVQAITKKAGPIDDVLTQTQTEYSKLQATTGAAGPTIDADSLRDIESLQELDFSRQDRLETLIQSRNEDRLQSLLQAKTRLSDCVNTLEEMELNHTHRMATFKTDLEVMDNAHAQKVKREKERQHRVAEALARRQAAFEKRGKSIERTIRKIERHHKIQVDGAVREAATIQGDVVAAEAKNQVMADQSAKVQNWTAKREEFKKQLESKENELAQARNDNETMKREIARLQHEVRVSQRATERTRKP
jgi:chromosome segregation ATPase